MSYILYFFILILFKVAFKSDIISFLPIAPLFLFYRKSYRSPERSCGFSLRPHNHLVEE